LAERPIKIGDWVSLNGVEGNVRKINARATEIEMFDRSTLIVPNSEFITKTVRNVTLSNPLGVVKVKINMPIDTDAKRVRSIMLDVMQNYSDVLADPAPDVTLDGFDANGLQFTATCYVASPRIGSRVRSVLMFDILDELRKEGLALHHTQTMTVLPTTPVTSQTESNNPLLNE
jgi:small-conductance mechanosensitive channel